MSNLSKAAIIEVLRKEDASNPISHAAFCMFALRERARHELTLDGLHYKMTKEGFNYNKSDYIPLLKTLSDLGIGKLTHDRKGNVIGLIELNTTIQSIGLAAVGKNEKLEKYNRKNRYIKLVDKEEIEPSVNKQALAGLQSKMSLVPEINGERGMELNISINGKLMPEEVLGLISNLKVKQTA